MTIVLQHPAAKPLEEINRGTFKIPAILAHVETPQLMPCLGPSRTIGRPRSAETCLDRKLKTLKNKTERPDFRCKEFCVKCKTWKIYTERR